MQCDKNYLLAIEISFTLQDVIYSILYFILLCFLLNSVSKFTLTKDENYSLWKNISPRRLKTKEAPNINSIMEWIALKPLSFITRGWYFFEMQYKWWNVTPYAFRMLILHIMLYLCVLGNKEISINFWVSHTLIRLTG